MHHCRSCDGRSNPARKANAFKAIREEFKRLVSLDIVKPDKKSDMTAYTESTDRTCFSGTNTSLVVTLIVSRMTRGR